MADQQPPQRHATRVSDYWNWLPAFRAVAETEHLPTAAAQLAVSSSALSRTVRLLEDNLETTLFVRSGRRITLNEHGRVLLAAVRDAMRRIDDGYQLIQPDALRGRVTLSGRSTHAWVFVPAIAAMRREHPSLLPSLRTLPDAAVGDALREGSLDVALVDHPRPEAAIVVEHLAKVDYRIYCGPSHPLFQRSDVAADEVLEHAFVGPPRGVSDNWPAEVARIVGAEVDLLSTGMSLAESGAFLALLPAPLAQSGVAEASLWCVPYDPAKALDLYAAYRRPVGEHVLTEYVLKVIRAVASG